MNVTTRNLVERKAVAPIIATLLMVAIAVIGGILIFVFAQGFFKDSSVGAPTFDKLAVTGYNTNDTGSVPAGGLTLGDGTSLSGAVVTTDLADGGLTVNEHWMIYVENSGSAAAVIKQINVGGMVYLPDSAGTGGVSCTTLSSTCPAAGKFVVLSSNTAALATPSVASQTSSTILLKQPATQTPTVIKNGKTLDVSVTTSNGGVSGVSVTMGVQR